MVLDSALARDHVRQCVNDLKRSRVLSPLFPVKKEPNENKTVIEVCIVPIVCGLICENQPLPAFQRK